MTEATWGVLFDVDGTLIDSTYLHVIAWQRALREAGHPVPGAAIHRLIGMGSEQLLRALVGEDAHDINASHSRHFSRLQQGAGVLPGAVELLREISDRGGTVVLATSAKEEQVPDLLATIGAEQDIDEVIHAGHVERGKPAGDIFRAALQAAGLQADRALVVGDTVFDVEAARSNGLGCVCVLTGGIGRHELQAAGALAVYADAAELLERLEESPIGALDR